MNIEDLKPIYFPNEIRVDKELFAPIFARATSCKAIMGYFRSSAISELASSLAGFLSADDTKIDFVVSPHLDQGDLDAIKVAIDSHQNLLPLLFPEFECTENNFQKNAKLALSYLIASEKINLKIALMGPNSMVHAKIWLFETDCGKVSVHGSGNASSSGLSGNFEQLTVSKNCPESESSTAIINAFEERFQKFWDGTYPSVKTIDLNEETIAALKEIVREESQGNIDLSKLITDLSDANEDDAFKFDMRQLVIPDWLNYTEGDFAHQAKAIKAWEGNERRGILSIATGGGKTLTSLTAATLVQSSDAPMLLVIAVPNTVLLAQWADEVRLFGVEPISSLKLSCGDVVKALKGAGRNLRLGVSKCEALVVSHDLLKTDELAQAISKLQSKVKTMLIGDEVHNLGSKGFIEAAPDCFDYRLGLSATVERQFDDDGTQFLLDYFGPIVFEFSVKEAIGNCLVPFKYYAHEVHLMEDEQDEWKDLTYEIRKLTYAINLPDNDPNKERWKLLCLKRRRIVEGAVSKAYKLLEILPPKEELIRTLIFCTNKNPEQLNVVNQFLIEKRVNFHQITQEETGRKKELQNIISAFSDDSIRVLTSKKVLDEGFNVPQTETAYLLASSTVERQWVQRLGRVLRKSSKTGKKHAVIHDFVVVPDYSETDSDMISLIKGELGRIMYFANLSINGLTQGGGSTIVNKFVDLMEDS